MARLINPRLALGGGIGYNQSQINAPRWEILPFFDVFTYGRYYINDHRKRLFSDVRLGASIPTVSYPWLRYTAGPMMQIGIGWEFATKRKAKWEIRLSQMFQRTVIEPGDIVFDFDPSNPVLITTNILLLRPHIGLGLNF